MQKRTLSQACQNRPPYISVERLGHSRCSGKNHQRGSGKMITGKGVFFSHSLRSPFPHCRRERQIDLWRRFSSRFAGLDSRKSKKAKNTPAHQEKFSSAPSSPFASASAAHTVKGRFAFRSAALHSTLDFLALLRPALHTTAAPRKIFFQGRRYRKAEKPLVSFALCLSSLSPFLAPRFPGASFPLSAGEPDAFPADVMLFPPPRLMLSGSRAFACPSPSPRFPHACLCHRSWPC